MHRFEPHRAEPPIHPTTCHSETAKSLAKAKDSQRGEHEVFWATTTASAFATRRGHPHRDQRLALPATSGAGVTNRSWSSDVRMLCQLSWFFFVSIGAERSP